MAREPSVADDDRSVGSEEQPTNDSGNTGLLHRRSYMKLAGATTAATAAFGTAASAASDDYEVIEARGQTIRLGQGETFENKLVDLTTGNGITLYVTGGNVEVRNIGFKGLYRGDGFVISVKAGSGNILFENIYMGDGATKEGSSFVHGPGGAFLHRDSNANVTFRNCNVQGFPNNGFYCSNTAHGGSVRFDTCFGKNNGVTTFRCASGNDVIENCVAYNDNTDYGPGYGNFSETSGRPVWVWNGGTVTIRDSHFADGPYPYSMVAGANGSPGRANFESGGYRGNIQRASGSTVNVSGAVSNDPDLSIPDGVPTSPEDAASGDSSSGDASGGDADDQLPNVILFDGDRSGVTRYEFAVDGDVEPSNYEGATIDAETGVEDAVAHGVVADWKDAFRFSGDIETLTVDGPATVLVNDEAVDPADYGEDLPHVLEVEGTGTPTSFEMTVEGTIDLDGDAEPEDEATTISGSTVQSSVTDETQTFRFSGALTDVTIINGNAEVRVDGEVIEPVEYGDHELLPHALVIDGTEADDPTAYSFETSGAVVKSTYRDATIDEDDVIEGRAVRGVADNWLDAYWFDGDIEEFTLRGNAAVDVQYNVRDQ
ncbi:hypothetical protein GS429_17485 [Natronorubrum sp. JWXQ-INN-674]|uniref:Right handed beta helix domain-containing protein n=1 Tax=Natronorubrum halalkaliphilum TaxID=2691917 RepID=A0A6B0VPS8_9EURY|nr:hypothetical protein [Natronorubrum halalkaliphilum]MXV63821.1 hypothetical protein [Natronorubrum halalkaliphilum]